MAQAIVECDHVTTRSRAKAPHHVHKEGFLPNHLGKSINFQDSLYVLLCDHSTAIAPPPPRCKAYASHPPYSSSRVTKMCDRVTCMWDPPPQIIYRKNNFGERRGEGVHQTQILITFNYKHHIQYIAHPPFPS